MRLRFQVSFSSFFGKLKIVSETGKRIAERRDFGQRAAVATATRTGKLLPD